MFESLTFEFGAEYNNRRILSGIHLIIGTRDSTFIKPSTGVIGAISITIFGSRKYAEGEYTQILSIDNQLMNGIRAFDINLRTRQNTVLEIVSSNGQVVSNINLISLLNQLVDFLSQPVHSTEFIFLFIRTATPDGEQGHCKRIP